MALEEVNEGSTAIITASFVDEDGVAVVPSAGTYRIDDLSSGTQILDDTDLPSLAASVDIELTEDDNAILHTDRAYETHVLTVLFDYGSEKHGTAEYRFRVVNLKGLVPAVP